MPGVYEGFDVRRYQDILDRAIARYGYPPKGFRRWKRDLNYEARDWLGYMQPVAPLYWQIYLYNALVASNAVDRPDIGAITILDKRWHFGERFWEFSPTKIERQVRRGLVGLNYIVMIEFEVFGNIHYVENIETKRVEFELYGSFRDDTLDQGFDYGRVIAPHVQGLVWGRSPSRRQRIQFPGGMFGSSGITVKRLTNFAGAVRYMVKPPYMGQLIRPRRGHGFVRYPWPGMPLRLHHQLFSNLVEYAYPDLTFASGEGSAVLAQAKRLWRERVPSGLKRYAYPQQPFHHLRLVRRRRPL